jgi:hypothetical protein
LHEATAVAPVGGWGVVLVAVELVEPVRVGAPAVELVGVLAVELVGGVAVEPVAAPAAEELEEPLELPQPANSAAAASRIGR